MTTDEKIVELAGAIRLLAWHVERLSEIAERGVPIYLEIRAIRAAMEKVQEATPVTVTPRFLDEALNSGDGSYKPFAGLHGEGQCEKATHDGRTGYLHGPEDDSPYTVDGVAYCGRCHRSMS